MVKFNFSMSLTPSSLCYQFVENPWLVVVGCVLNGAAVTTIMTTNCHVSTYIRDNNNSNFPICIGALFDLHRMTFQGQNVFDWA